MASWRLTAQGAMAPAKLDTCGAVAAAVSGSRIRPRSDGPARRASDRAAAQSIPRRSNGGRPSAGHAIAAPRRLERGAAADATAAESSLA